MSESVFEGRTFTAPPERTARLAERLLAHVDADRPLRVLDLGCGTGGQIRALAARLPRARFTGIDISESNIAAARIAGREIGERATFVAADYLEYADAPFDVIWSDSVLQNVAAEDERLYGKLAADLNPQGLLAISVPYRCAFNGALWALRRAARIFRGPRLEAAALAAAARLHPEWDIDLLRERLPYLYLLPARVDGEKMRGALARRSLELLESADLPHESLAQPRHRFLVFRKTGR